MATTKKVVKIATKASKPAVSLKPASSKNKVVAKKAPPPAAPVKKVVKKVTAPAVSTLKPCKRSFTQTELNTMLAEAGDIEVKQVKAVLNKLQDLLMASMMKRGIGKVKMLGLTFAVTHVPEQKMAAVKKGAEVKGFGGTTVISPGKAAYVKPARMRMRVRPLKGFKDAVLA